MAIFLARCEAVERQTCLSQSTQIPLVAWREPKIEKVAIPQVIGLQYVHTEGCDPLRS